MNLLIKTSPAAWTVRTKCFLAACLVGAGLGCAASQSWAGAAAAPARRSSTTSFDVAFKEFRLKNGLRVVLAEDHSAPTYSICVTYNVGSRDERPGRTGFAHLFEHMLFQGSENVGKGEHFILVQNNGGSANGTTSADRTNYFETLPANQLELGIFLEADRMRSPSITQANFDNQRLTVQEERRQSYDNRPYGRTYETVVDTAYDNFAYKHSTIGSMDDLNAATVEDAAKFFRAYYAPNNAVVSLVGDFKSETALALIKKYFESIAAQPRPPAPDTNEPAQKAERRRTIEDAFTQAPRIDIVYKIPPGNTADWYALAMLGQVLSSGVSSRLYQKLVKEKELALSVSAGPDERRGPSLFWFTINVRPGTDLAALEKLLYEEIARVQNEPVADSELDKVRMQLKRQRAQQLYSSRSRANTLGHYAVYYDDPQLINSVWQKYEQVTKSDLQRAARAYFSESNRTVVTTLPKAEARRQR
ncbi:MAG TPA: pitrilysin family protein [Candidatus Binatia bacterium]|nr:pitrilysin family protein [Candidatus Binatia bacterium]